MLPSSPILIAGPTAVGKSEIALLLAERIGGEIISVDSMQVYRGLDLGTAKPSAADRARVPHHLIDVVDLTEPFDAAKFASLAHKAVAEIQSRGRVPILCGGTGLYFKAFLDGLGDAPPADANMRAELETMPLAALLCELEQRDPATFARIDRKNPRRVVRAIEVIRLTGRPFSKQRAQWGEGGEPRSADIPVRGFTGLSSPVSIKSDAGSSSHELATGKLPEPADRNVCPTFQGFCLTRSAPDLYARINARVDKMFGDGLVEETRRLLDHGLGQNKNAMQAIGYRQVVEHLRGESPLQGTVELVKIRTRQFAKRQMTWYRRQLNMEWIELNPDDSSASVAALVKARLKM